MRSKDNEKMQQFKYYCNNKKIDIAMIIEMNSKQITIIISMMKQKIIKLGKRVELAFTDSKVHKTTKNNQL